MLKSSYPNQEGNDLKFRNVYVITYIHAVIQNVYLKLEECVTFMQIIQERYRCIWLKLCNLSLLLLSEHSSTCKIYNFLVSMYLRLGVFKCVYIVIYQAWLSCGTRPEVWRTKWESNSWNKGLVIQLVKPLHDMRCPKRMYLPNPSEQDVAQGQFVSGVQQVWIQSFPSSKLVAFSRRKNLVCSSIYP